MLPKSIRWRLQLWYGVILVIVLAGFGVTAYRLERNRRFRAVDEELQQRMAALARALHANAPQSQGGPEGFDDFPPPPTRPEEQDIRDNTGPSDRGFHPRRPPPRRKFKLAVEDAALFHSNGPAACYYYVRHRSGRLLSMSSNVPPNRLFVSSIPDGPISDMPVSGIMDPQDRAHVNNVNDLPSLAEKRVGRVIRISSNDWQPPTGALREITLTTPPGEFLVVGRSIQPELDELRHFAWTLAGIGGVVLLLGLVGGWVLASRAIRPIEDISTTAVKIAAGDLSQRINAADTDNELDRLAGVLNSTFARLEASFAQQAQFTADAAHELRTPVSVLLTQAQTALKQERSAADYRATIEVCQRAAQRMRGLLESLLELARLDAGQEPMKKVLFDLGDTVRECVDLVRPLAQERNIKIETDLPTLEWVGDMDRLAQVVTNLLTNAIHYNKDGGSVRVAVSRQKHEALITVADNGVGISEEDLPRIFERFYRADKSRSNAKGRTGLGLAISKAIVEAHGGRFEVSSELGKGTTITLHLPKRD